MISSASPMSEILNGMAVADVHACHEFVSRQSPAQLVDLSHGVDLAGDIVRECRMTRPDELVAWKYPDQNESVGPATLKKILESAANGDEAELRSLLTDQSFANLCVLASTCAHLERAIACCR